MFVTLALDQNGKEGNDGCREERVNQEIDPDMLVLSVLVVLLDLNIPLGFKIELFCGVQLIVSCQFITGCDVFHFRTLPLV